MCGTSYARAPQIVGLMSHDPFNFAPLDPRRFIPGYRAVIFSEADGGLHVVELSKAISDEEALAQAREAAASFAFELWDALVLLGSYEASGDTA